MMQIGPYKCILIEFGTFKLDGGSMFGVVPKVLWQKKIQADEKNRIPMNCRSLLIQGNNKTILVDTGIGTKLSEKLKKIYGITDDGFDIATALKGAGIKPDDVTDVILTHLHFDHCGGSTTLKDEKLVPTFSNAVYHVQKEQWESATNPTIRDVGSFMQDNFIPLKEYGILNLLNGPGEFIDGIELLVTHGHTRGQQHLLIHDDATPLFYCADLIPTSAHMKISWHMAYDNQPTRITEEKEAILNRAEKENWLLVFEHDPQTGLYQLGSNA